MLDFGYNSGRYRVTTTFLMSELNIKKAERLLNSIRLDLDRRQFLLVNYAKYLINPEALSHLDRDYIHTQKEIDCRILIKEQLKIYEDRVTSGNMEESTKNGYMYSINLHLLPFFSGIKIQEVDINIIESFISRLDVTKSRVKKILQPLREVMKRALRQDLIVINPFNAFTADLLSQHQNSEYVVDPFSLAEIDSIITTAPHLCIANLIKFGFWTGMRLGEIFALDWSDIDFIDEIISVNKSVTIHNRIKTPKTHAGTREIEMTPTAKEALLAQFELTGHDHDQRVFKTPRGVTWRKTSHFGDYWRKILLSAKIKHRNAYQMRHTFISYMLNIGNSPLVLYRMVGHTSPEIMYKYYARFIKKGKTKQLIIE